MITMFHYVTSDFLKKKGYENFQIPKYFQVFIIPYLKLFDMVKFSTIIITSNNLFNKNHHK
jgi:hypothetical protein